MSLATPNNFLISTWPCQVRGERGESVGSVWGRREVSWHTGRAPPPALQGGTPTHRPPVASNVKAVVKLHSGEAMKATSEAISWMVPQRFIGILSVM